MSAPTEPGHRDRRGHRHGTSGWVPNQHGAWAMVVIPWLLGTWLRFHEGRGDAYALVGGLLTVPAAARPMRRDGRRFTPKQLGTAEAGFSILLIALALATG